MRCRFMDELLMQALAARNVEVVVSLGAGLDTRPWRLDLPSTLRWIEVDFPQMLDYKAAVLASERPKCQVERVAADLTQAEGREAVFAAAGNRPGLIATEGLFMYLPAGAVEALLTEALRFSGIRHLLVDVPSQDLMRRAHRGAFSRIEEVRAKDRLEGGEILEAIERNGWRRVAARTYVPYAWEVAPARIREMLAALNPPEQRLADDISGIHLFHA
jgi:methyltransferase (TIGR00027 family)